MTGLTPEQMGILRQTLRDDEPKQPRPEWVTWLIVGTVAVVVCLVGLFVLAGAMKSYSRYQKRADAKNAITVTHTKIAIARQQAQINYAQIAATKAEAEKRYQASVGIRRAQDEIAKTLTPLYIQHEAIQKLPAARAVYIPSGAQGIPAVNVVGQPETP